MLEIKQNNRYEVLTPSGWSDFDGVKKKIVDQTLIIEFIDKTNLQCTLNHLIKIDGEFVEAELIQVGQKIQNKIVKNIKYSYEPIEVFDLINVNCGNEYYTNEIISHNCEFMGSVGTLISSTVLKNLTFKSSLGNSNIVGLSILENPIEKHNYIMTVDTSRGKSLDYSAFVVIDTTSIPYKVVCKYKNNEISPIAYPSIIAKIGRYYNDAHVLVELNDNGQQISDMLFDDHEYENLLTTVSSNKKTVLSWNVANKSARGIMTSKTVKRIGCNLLKNLIERNKLIPNDYDIIFELSTFINKGNSYEADEGYHDDLVMCLVLFSWVTNQQFFSDMNNVNIREKLYRDQLNQIEENLLPLPISSNEYDEGRIVEDGVVWDVVKTDLYK